MTRSATPLAAALALALAGCLTSAPAGGDAAGSPAREGASPGGLVEIAISGHLWTDGALLPDQVACRDPSGCQVDATELLNVTGTLAGTIVDRFRATLKPDGSWVVVGSQVFTGTIEGCGAGTLAFTYAGAGGESDPEHPGDLLGFEDLALVPGTQTTGTVGVVSAALRETFHINPVTYAAAGLVNGTLLCRPSDVPRAASRDGATEVPVAGRFTSRDLTPDQLACSPTRPGGCELYATITLDFTGTMEGTTLDVFHLHTNADGSQAAGGFRAFTGSVDGCGSGSLTLLLDGPARFDPATERPGAMHMREPTMRLAPGSTTTGLASLVDAEVTLEFNATGTRIDDGTVSGTLWCRAPPVVVARGHEGARAVPIDATITSPGFLAPDFLACDPTTAGVCEFYANQLVDVEGTMNGTIVDIYHGHFNPDGSFVAKALRVFTGTIDGCGSGTLVVTIDGTAARPEPIPTRPGYMTLREPPMVFVPGATTTGLSDVVDAEITIEAIVHGGIVIDEGDGTLRGTVWCGRDADERGRLASAGDAARGFAVPQAGSRRLPTELRL